MKHSKRSAARALGEQFYVSVSACKRGHSSKRYVSTGNCVECLLITGEKYYPTGDNTPKAKRTREDRIEQVRQWRKENPEKRRAHQLKKYGMTYVEYCAMLAAQDGLCAICRNEFQSRRETNVDHCHTTGKVRAILCGPCNRGIAFFGEDPARIDKAAAYLRGFL